MKKTILLLLLFGAMRFSFAQSTTATNVFAAGRFTGYGATSGLLESRTNNFTRMTIQSNASTLGLLDGRVTMANTVPVGFVPSARLHLFQFGGSGAANADLFRTDGLSTTDNTWRMFTGLSQAGATEKFKLYIPANTDNAIAQTAINTGRMYFATNGANMRMRINGVQNPTVNGSVINTEGYIGMGNFNTNTPLNDVGTGPWTLLHLYGPNNFTAGFFGSGFRTWMKTGMSTYENSDHLYIGMKDEIALTGGTNFSDAVMAWGDDGGASPDDMRFIFTEAAPAAGFCTSCPTNSTGFDGREIMRMIYNGNVGIGPVFSKMPLAGNNQPQSLVHMNIDGNQSLWLQMSNQLGTGQSAGDGVRLGIAGSPTASQNGSAYLYNQENKHLLFSTNAPTSGINLFLGITNERMRITSIGAPTPLFGGIVYGVYNPAAIANTNTTRASLSYNPAAPIVRPMSLFHIGYGASVNNAGTVTDGWRPWMDIGTYTGGSFDQMYVGLKAEGSTGGKTTYDAVINWGRNKDSVPNVGPDHLRFIFSGNYNGGSANEDQSDEINAAELGRFYPGRDTTGLDTLSKVTYGRFGIGDFTAAGLNQEPTHKLDVDGNGRFRLLPDTLYQADTSVKKVVYVDETGVLRWGSGNFIGHYCKDSITLNAMADDFEIPTNDFNYYFWDDSSSYGKNNVGIGIPCHDTLIAKLQIRNMAMEYGILVNTITDSLTDNYGVYVNAQNGFVNSTGIHTQAIHPVTGFNIGIDALVDSAGQTDIAGKFRAGQSAGSSFNNYGVYSEGRGATGLNVGVYGQGDALGGSATSIGGQFIGGTSTLTNFGVNCQAVSPSAAFNYGGAFRATNAANNYAVYGQVAAATGTGVGTPPGPNYAGYFLGDVFISGVFGPSDVNMKQNIDSISNADSILALLKPKYFDFKQTGQWKYLNLSQQRQTGLLAQDVETVLPSFVKDNVCPDQYDSTGVTVVQPSFGFKTIDYDKFIPLLIAGHQTQASKIDSLENANDNLDSIVDALNNKNDEEDSLINVLQAENSDLNDRLTALENCINALHLCDGPSMLPTNNNSTGGNNGNNSNDNATNVELSDAQSIVLDQNVPNPFAEQTTITYNLTEGVQKAQLLFYNAQGKLINSQELQTKPGKGQLNVFANDLSNGVYTYTLVVDGKIIDTKRMVKNK